MAKTARRSSTLAIQFVLLMSSVYYCVNDEIRRREIIVAEDFDSIDDGTVTATFHCLSTTIFGLLTADCTAQNISSVSQMHLDQHVEVQLLRLADNRLARLDPDDFGRIVPHLQQLYLARNFIANVDEHAFRNLHTLQILDLADNRLISIPVRSLRHLPALRIISLRGNAITQVDAYSFAGLPIIESIDMTACRLVHVDRRGFAECPHLADLSLAGNNLAQLSPATVHYLPTPSVLRRMRLDGNPWLCDCRLRWLHERVQLAAIVEFSAWRPQPVCDTPHLLRNRQWRHLSPQQFACPSRIIADSHRDSTLVIAAAGTNVTVSCVVVGDPEPSVRWARNSPTSNTLPLPSITRQYDSESTISEGELLLPWRLVSSLHLVDVSASDGGDYHCTADNVAGRAEMTYTVVITSVPGSNRTEPRDYHSHVSATDNRALLIVRVAVLIGSAMVIVVATGVAGCAVAIRLRTVTANKVDDVRERPTGTVKSATVPRSSQSVITDRSGRRTTSLVGSIAATRQITSRHQVSVAWADSTLSPVTAQDRNYQQQQPTTNVEHQFRMTIFPAACSAYD